MSPRRRHLLIGSLVLVAVLMTVVLLVRRGAPAGSAVPQDRPGPVLLVPGYGGGTAALNRLAEALRAQGHDSEVVPAVGQGTGDLTAQAERLRQVASARIAAGAPSVDVVGYSAGGVVVRIWAAELGGARQARRIVTLGAPHHGASVAALAFDLAPGACPTACRQLEPGSTLLDHLPDTVPGPVWTSVWSSLDEVVTPPRTAELRGAVNIPLQSVCPRTRTSHGALPTDPLVISIVTAALAPAPLRQAPGAAECGALRGPGTPGAGG